MKDYNRENKSQEQELLDQHIARAKRELLQAFRIINGLGIPRMEKRSLERQFRPLLDLLEQQKITLPTNPQEEIPKRARLKDKNKEVKGVNGRRKESK